MTEITRNNALPKLSNNKNQIEETGVQNLNETEPKSNKMR